MGERVGDPRSCFTRQFGGRIFGSTSGGVGEAQMEYLDEVSGNRVMRIPIFFPFFFGWCFFFPKMPPICGQKCRMFKNLRGFVLLRSRDRKSCTCRWGNEVIPVF